MAQHLHRRFIRKFLLYVLQQMRGNDSSAHIHIDEFKDYIKDKKNLNMLVKSFLDQLYFRSTFEKVEIYENLEKIISQLRQIIFEEKINPATLSPMGFNKKSLHFEPMSYSRLLTRATNDLKNQWQEIEHQFNFGGKSYDLVGRAFHNDIMKPLIGVEIKSSIAENWNRNVGQLRRTGFIFEHFYIYNGLWFNVDEQKFELSAIGFREALKKVRPRKKFWEKNENILPTKFSIPNSDFAHNIDGVFEPFESAMLTNFYQTTKNLSKKARIMAEKEFQTTALMTSHIPAIDKEFLDRFDHLYGVTKNYSLIANDRHFKRLNISLLTNNLSKKDSSTLQDRFRCVLHLNPNILEQDISFRYYKKLVEFLSTSEMVLSDENLKNILNSYRKQLTGLQKQILTPANSYVRETIKSQLLGLNILLLLITVQEGGFLLILLPSSYGDDKTPLLEYLFSYDYDDNGDPINAFDIGSHYLSNKIFINQKTDYSIISLRKPSISREPEWETLSFDQDIDEIEEEVDKESEEHGLLAGGFHWLKQEISGPISALRFVNKQTNKLLDQRKSLDTEVYIKRLKNNNEILNDKVIKILSDFEDRLKIYVDYKGNNPPTLSTHNLLSLIEKASAREYLFPENFSIDHQNVSKNIEIFVDDDQFINQVFIQAIKNSIKHGFDEINKDVTLTFSSEKNIDNNDDEWIIIKIQDNGSGMLEANRISEEVDETATRYGLPNLIKVVKNNYGQVIFKSNEQGIQGLLIEIKLRTAKKMMEVLENNTEAIGPEIME